jgi:uncharacterized protein (TIGR03067 family)
MQTREGIVLVFGLALLSQVWVVARNCDDTARIQGTWALTWAEDDGAAVASPKAKGSEVFFGRETIRLADKDNKEVWLMRYTLDATASPAAVTLTVVGGEGKGKTALGIYELTDDTLKFCFAPPGAERPKDFDAPAGSGSHLLVLARVRQ